MPIPRNFPAYPPPGWTDAIGGSKPTFYAGSGAPLSFKYNVYDYYLDYATGGLGGSCGSNAPGAGGGGGGGGVTVGGRGGNGGPGLVVMICT